MIVVLYSDKHLTPKIVPGSQVDTFTWQKFHILCYNSTPKKKKIRSHKGNAENIFKKCLLCIKKVIQVEWDSHRQDQIVATTLTSSIYLILCGLSSGPNHWTNGYPTNLASQQPSDTQKNIKFKPHVSILIHILHHIWMLKTELSLEFCCKEMHQAIRNNSQLNEPPYMSLLCIRNDTTRRTIQTFRTKQIS